VFCIILWKYKNHAKPDTKWHVSVMSVWHPTRYKGCHFDILCIQRMSKWHPLYTPPTRQWHAMTRTTCHVFSQSFSPTGMYPFKPGIQNYDMGRQIGMAWVDNNMVVNKSISIATVQKHPCQPSRSTTCLISSLLVHQIVEPHLYSWRGWYSVWVFLSCSIMLRLDKWSHKQSLHISWHLA